MHLRCARWIQRDRAAMHSVEDHLISNNSASPAPAATPADLCTVADPDAGRPVTHVGRPWSHRCTRRAAPWACMALMRSLVGFTTTRGRVACCRARRPGGPEGGSSACSQWPIPISLKTFDCSTSWSGERISSFPDPHSIVVLAQVASLAVAAQRGNPTAGSAVTVFAPGFTAKQMSYRHTAPYASKTDTTFWNCTTHQLNPFATSSKLNSAASAI